MSGLISLVARGPQDVYLTGNPDTSYFRTTYRRPTPFVLDTVQIQHTGTEADGRISTFTLNNQGDMVSGIYIRNDGDPSGPVSGKMRTKINYVRLLIGGQEIVKMTGGVNGDLEKYQALMSNTYCKAQHADHDFMHGYAPLHFWFCEYWGAALPLCALKYHEVVIEVKWAETPDIGFPYEMWAKTIWLGNDEKRNFVEAPQLSYLIDQWQNSETIKNLEQKSIDLGFRHPVRALILDIRDRFINDRYQKVRLTTNGIDICNIGLDQAEYDIYYHCPFGTLEDYRVRYPIIPFALDLSTNQPSGSLNFSRLEDVKLVSDDEFEEHEKSVLGSTITAVSTNIFTIKNGMGGLVFAN